MLKRTEGKLPKSALFKFSSFLDTAWFFVSTMALYLIDLAPLAITVPIAYSIYTIFGWVYATRLLKRRGIPDSPEDLIVPPKYIAYSQSFSLIFFALCVLVIASPWLPTAAQQHTYISYCRTYRTGCQLSKLLILFMLPMKITVPLSKDSHYKSRICYLQISSIQYGIDKKNCYNRRVLIKFKSKIVHHRQDKILIWSE